MSRLMPFVTNIALLAPSTQQLADTVLESFQLDHALVTHWEQFLASVARLVHHAEAVFLGLDAPMAPDYHFATGRSLGILKAIWGESGAKTAFELARTGKEGGLLGVLRQVVRHMAEQRIRELTRMAIGAWWGGLSINQKLQAPDEFMERFGHLIPEEMTEGSAGRMRADFPGFLGRYAEAMRRWRNIGRR